LIGDLEAGNFRLPVGGERFEGAFLALGGRKSQAAAPDGGEFLARQQQLADFERLVGADDRLGRAIHDQRGGQLTALPAQVRFVIQFRDRHTLPAIQRHQQARHARAQFGIFAAGVAQRDAPADGVGLARPKLKKGLRIRVGREVQPGVV